MLAAAPAIEASADALANQQGFQAIAGLAETGQLGAASVLGLTGALLGSIATAHNGLISLGNAGPLYAATPYAAARNVQFAGLTNSMLSKVSSIAAAQAFLGLGTAAMLTNSGRRFLISTYFGI